MTLTLKATFIGIISLLTLSLSAQAQTTGKLTVDILSHFQKVYSAAASATDKASAEKSVVSIASELKQLDALTPLLAKSSKPTDAEMSTVAEATAKMEGELNRLIQTMARNLKNSEVRKIISPSMTQFDTKARSARATMDKLYPADKMKPLVQAAKARIQINK